MNIPERAHDQDKPAPPIASMASLGRVGIGRENSANNLPRTFVLLGFSSSALRPIFDSESTIRTMRAIALWINLSPILGGWAVCLSDGRELARFRGPGARGRAERFVHGF